MNWKHAWSSIRETWILSTTISALTTSKCFIVWVLSFIYNSVVADSIKGWSVIFKFANILNEDENITELSREYNAKYLYEGWIVITSLIKLTMLISWVIIIWTLSSDNPVFARAIILCPSVIVVLIGLDESFKRNQFIKEYWILFSVLAYGWIWINGNLKKDNYYIYEFWFVYYCFANSASIFVWMEWK